MPHRPRWMRRRDKSRFTSVVSNPSSGFSTRENVPSERPSSGVDHSPATKDLWNEAYMDLRKSEYILVDRFEKILLSEDPEEHAAMSKEEQLTWIIEAKLALMEHKKWIAKFAGKSIEVRKQIDRLVKFVRMMRESLSIVANIDPLHLGVPVAAMCLLTSLMISHSQQTTHAIDGLSYIAGLVCRFAEIEKLYLGDKHYTDTTSMTAETIKLYRSVLEFQVKVVCQFDRSAAHQFVRNLVELDGWKEQLEQIRSCEAACEKSRVLLDTRERRQGMENLERRLRDIDVEVQQRSDALLSELSISREDHKGWRMSQEESECLQTLRTLDYESDKSRIADRVPGTCQWFLSHDKYRSWLDDTRSRLLWVTADPGCGKSVLSKFLVNSYIDDATNDTTNICYFFFRDGSEKNQDGTNALCALLHQLFKQKRLLIRHALPDFECNRSKLPGLFETLWSIFLRATEDPEAGIVICILDALDECGERTRTSLLRHIGVLFSASQTSATVKFLITSRPNTTIEDALWESYPNVSSVRLMGENEHEVSTIQKEISLVIGKKVDKFKEKRQQCDIHDEAHHNILKRLAEIENRTYLWVSLIFAELDKSVRSNQGTLLQVIEAIPSSLQAAYERILSYSTNATKAKRLLHFVLAAQRPFTLEEMNTAIATTERRTSINQLELEPKATFLETMRELCGLFISVSDSRIYLIHQTAREFLLATKSERQLLPRATGTWMYSMDYQASHFELAKTSLLYLHLCELECQSRVVASHDVVDGVCKPPDFAQRQVFRTYAATQWYYHVSESDSSAVDSLMDLMLSITTPDSHAFKTWMAFRSRKPVYSPDSVAEQLADLDQLSVAACFGIEPVLNSLLKVKQHLTDQKPMIYRAATRAIEYCPGVFHHFLDNGLDVESRIEDSRSFMHEAARFDCVEVAQLLIGAGHLVNCEDKDLREPLFFAVGNYAWGMVSLLIENGALVNHRDARGKTVLYQAVRLQSLRMITELLEHGAEHDLTDFSGRTPLSWAADDLSRVVGGPAYSIAKLLIEHGAKIGSSDNEGRTPLEYAVAAGSWDIVALLIENGAPVDSIDRDGRTPLSHAAEDRRGPIIDFLVKRSAQVNTKCIEMRTPLSYAAGSCRTPQIKSLLENGAAVDDSDWRCNTPLMYAAQVDIDNSQLAWQRRFPGASFPHVGIGSIQHSIKVLLSQGANPVAVNEDGCSPLLILERLAPRHWRHLTQEKSEAVKNDIRNLLRHHGADGIKSPTSSDVLSQVVVLLTAKLIEIIRNSKACATRDYEVASKSSIQLFRRWRLHPTVSSITVQDNKTIEQEIPEFVQNQWEQTARIISCSQPRPINDLDIAKAEDLASRNEYGGLSPLQMSDHCSYFLQRLAELQQRLFNVNTCLYYIESNPEDCSETIDELISKATRPQSQNNEYGRSCDSESDHELSCQGLLGSCDVG